MEEKKELQEFPQTVNTISFHNPFFLNVFTALTLAISTTLAYNNQWVAMPGYIPAIFRWTIIGLLSYACFKRRSLTTWILFSMVIGAEVGFDFPAFAQKLKIVSKVFLKLSKTIIAPFIFGTLVLGIAGQTDLNESTLFIKHGLSIK